MTIIFDTTEFWIETHRLLVTIQDAAGIYTSSPTITLDRAGHYVGNSSALIDAPTNDNSRALGAIQINVANAGGFGTPTYGEQVSTIRASVQKVAGTAGASPLIIQVMVFLRK